jgi:hypothetical protein
VTKRELRYLFIINVLLLKVQFVIRDTNEHIALLEEQANERLGELLQKQIEADSQVLACWEDNLEAVLSENEQITAERDRLREKLKAKKRLMRELEG